MIARYGAGDCYFLIEDDGRIRAAGDGEYGTTEIDFIPQRAPEEGTGAYEVWNGHGEQALDPGDKAIQLVDQDRGDRYLLIFPADSAICAYALGHNFHTGAASYLLNFTVQDDPANDAERWRLFEWLTAW